MNKKVYIQPEKKTDLGAVCKSFLNGWPIMGNDGTAIAFLTLSFHAPAPFFRNSISILYYIIIRKFQYEDWFEENEGK